MINPLQVATEGLLRGFQVFLIAIQGLLEKEDQRRKRRFGGAWRENIRQKRNQQILFAVILKK